MAKKLLAKEVNEALKKQIQKELEEIQDSPCLAVFRVGEDPPSISYEKAIKKKLEKMGFSIKTMTYALNTFEEDFLKDLKKASQDKEIHGILPMLPLPLRWDQKKLVETIQPYKDVDGNRKDQLGLLMSYEKEAFENCAVGAVLAFLDHYKISVFGKRVCILGAGLLIGRPLSMLLLKRKATVTICNTKTPNPTSITKASDILIGASGHPHFITKDYLSKDQIVLDCGTSFVDGKMLGDLDPKSCEKDLLAYTPTPGGISGVTTSILALHLLKAYRLLGGLDE